MKAAFDVSVVVVTHNRCEMLPFVLESVLNQETAGSSYELIVVDNNSIDQTRQVIEEFVERASVPVRYILEEKQGIPFARNTGIAAAKSPIVAFTDDDGYVAPDWVANIKRGLDEHSEVDYVGGPVFAHWSAERPSWLTQEHWSPLAILDYGSTPFYVNQTKPLCLIAANLACRRQVFEEIGPFAVEFLRCQDHELQVRMWKNGRQGMYIPEIVATARVQNERLTKRYHRRWHVKHGHYMAQLRDSSFEKSRARLLDVPGHVYRRALADSIGWLLYSLLGQHDKAFRYEAKIGFSIGFVRKRLKKYFASETAAP